MGNQLTCDCACCDCCSCNFCVGTRADKPIERPSSDIQRYKAKNMYDFFISYRQSCDAVLAKSIYYLLNNKLYPEERDRRVITCFLDQCCLSPGESWKEGFEKGLKNSSVIIMLISEGALGQIKTHTTENEDNLLYEWEMALNYHDSEVKAIIPILVGKEEGNEISKFNAFKLDGYPDTKCKNTSLSCRQIIDKVLQIQGIHLSVGANLDLFFDIFTSKLIS